MVSVFNINQDEKSWTTDLPASCFVDISVIFHINMSLLNSGYLITNRDIPHK